MVLTNENSLWGAEHLFLVDKDVPGQEMITLSGDFISKVYDGPFKEVGNWAKEMMQMKDKSGRKVEDVYFFYTTCPGCAKAYGNSYVVAFGKLEDQAKAA